MRSLYDLLGIKRDASEAEVTAAYRRRAAETHPDRGGKREEFEAVTHARAVLLDPARREKYDRTGDASEAEPDNAESIALQLLQQAVFAAIEGAGAAPAETHIINQAKVILDGQLMQARQQIQNAKRAVQQLGDVRKRLKNKGEKPVIEQMIDWRIAALTQAASDSEPRNLALQRALDILGQYSFEVERAPARQGMIPPEFLAQMMQNSRSNWMGI